MTFKHFVDLFSKEGTISIKDLKRPCTVAIDASIKIAQSLLSMQYGERLTGPDGKITSHINICLANIAEFKRCGIVQIWIFDNSLRKSYKIVEQEKRRKARAKSRKEIEGLQNRVEELRENTGGYVEDIDTPPSSDDEDEETKHDDNVLTENNRLKLIARIEKEILVRKSRDLGDFAQAVQDLKFMLTTLGIAYIDAPEDTEAEQIGATLASQNKIDYFITTDPDYLLFEAGIRLSCDNAGTACMLKKIPRESKYDIYSLDTALMEHSLTSNQFMCVGICMGVDIISHPDYTSDSGIKGIGVKNVLAVVKGTKANARYKLHDYHYEGMEKFGAIIDMDIILHHSTNIVKVKTSIPKFKAWILKEKGFNPTRIDKFITTITATKTIPLKWEE